MISICIPAYNSGKFLSDTLASAHRETPELVTEILVCDNCSTDDTVAIATKWASRDPRVRIVSNPANIGSVKNFQLCTNLATNSFVKFLCSDDVLVPGSLRDQMSLLRKNPGSVITCDIVVVDSNLGSPRYWSYFHAPRQVRSVLRAASLRRDNIFGGPSNFLFENDRASLPRQLWDHSYKYVADVLFPLRVVNDSGGILNTGRPGYLYRRHPNSDTEVNCSSADRNNAEWARLLTEIQRSGKETPASVMGRLRYLKFRLRRKWRSVDLAGVAERTAKETIFAISHAYV